MTDQTPQQPRAFLSYSRRDTAQASLIFDALTAVGVEVFRDTDDILPAEDWRERLRGLIVSADAVIFLMSPHSVKSEVCGWEVDQAVARNKRLVPVLLSAVEEADTPEAVGRLNYVFATSGHDFDAAIGRIASAVSTDIGWVRDHTRYSERGDEWFANGAGRAALLRGDALTEAEAWLARRPSTAPALTEHTRAWLSQSRSGATRRQRSWVVGSLMVAAVSIALGVVAEVNRRVATEQRDRAERILDSGSQTANDLVFDMAQRFRDRSGVPQELVQDLLGRSKHLLDQLSEAGEARPDLKRSRAAALAEMSITLARQGDLAGAKATAAEATAVFRSLVAIGGAKARADLAVGLDREGDIQLQVGDITVAAARYGEAHALNTALVAEDPRATWRTNLAVSEEKLGDIAALNDKPSEALMAFGRALAVRESSASRGAAVLLEKQGDALIMLGSSGESHAAYLRSLELTQALAAAAPDDTQLVRDQSVIRQKLGDLLLDIEGVEAAEPHFAADLEIARRLHQADPGREDWVLDLAVSLDRFGVLQFQLGDIDGAANLLREAFALLSARSSAKPQRVDLQSAATKASQKLSLISFAAGDFTSAAGAALTDESRIGEAVAMGALLEEEHADAINNVAWYSLFTGNPAMALTATRKATEMRPTSTIYRLNLAHALLLNGRNGEAMEVYLADASDEWKAMISADFDEFAKHGVAPDLIDTARAALIE